MEDVQTQLKALRRRIAQIDRKWEKRASATASPSPAPGADLSEVSREYMRPARYVVDQVISGEVVETPFGKHFETERLWENHRLHGSMDIGHLIELPRDLLAALSEGEIPDSDPTLWAFLDTETTGLAGGPGVCAFLVGIGNIEPAGFRLRQFFMRDYSEELSLLWGLAAYLERFDVLVTYNGRAYDQPLLEERYAMARATHPFARLRHLDILFGARRVWKLRLESCRLVDLENRVLGVERQGDLPGEMIPYYYFEYLRTRQAFRLVPVFHHNAIDILSLACLTAIVPAAFGPEPGAGLRHGTDLVGVARWLHQAGRQEESLTLMCRAVELGLPDHLLFRTMWDIASLEKRMGREDRAMAMLEDLAASRNPFRAKAYEALARHYERNRRDLPRALELTRLAIELDDTPELRRREARLARRLR